MKCFMKSVVATTALIFSLQVHAQFSILKSDEDFVYSNYYKIKVDPAAEKIDLLSFENIGERFPLPVEPYKRDQHFGGWLRDDTPTSCLNTRAKVLIRDSKVPPTFTPNGCTVQTGHWDDPYTARLHTAAKDIQIDHVVALKNAYMTGAHEWNFAKRCLYANYMGNRFHLLSVNGPANLKKSDHSPSGYVPPNKQFTCEFIKTWLNIKLIWSLRITPQEGDAIQRIATENNCSRETFMVPTSALAEQLQYQQDHADLCTTPTSTLQAF